MRKVSAVADTQAIHVMSLRVPRPLIESLREIAEAEHRTVSQEMRRLIAQRVAEAEKEAAAA